VDTGTSLERWLSFDAWKKEGKSPRDAYDTAILCDYAVAFGPDFTAPHMKELLQSEKIVPSLEEGKVVPSSEVEEKCEDVFGCLQMGSIDVESITNLEAIGVIFRHGSNELRLRLTPALVVSRVQKLTEDFRNFENIGIDFAWMLKLEGEEPKEALDYIGQIRDEVLLKVLFAATGNLFAKVSVCACLRNKLLANKNLHLSKSQPNRT
jgi:hypothetical protein